MNHILQCPTCSQPFQVLAEQAGTIVKCPSCSQVVAIPNELADSTSPEQPPPSLPQQPVKEPQSQLVFGCPECSGKFGVTPEMFDQQVTCPHCSATVLIQNPNQTKKPPPIKTTKPAAPEKPSSVKSFDKNPEPAVKPTQESQASENKNKNKPRWKREDVASSDLFAPGHVSRSSSADLPSNQTEATSPAQERTQTKTPTKKSKTKFSSTSQLLDESTPAVPDEPERKPVDHLLPPRFEVEDPNAIRVKLSDDENKVFLPDGKGGVKRIDNRVVRVTHGGEEIILRNSTEAEKARRRLITNIVTISILLLTLLFVFMALRKYL